MNTPELYRDLATAHTAELRRRAVRNSPRAAQASQLRQRRGRLLVRLGRRLSGDH
jgi:hypothetical protein